MKIKIFPKGKRINYPQLDTNKMNYFYTKNKSIISPLGFYRRIALDFDGVCAEMTGDYYEIGVPIKHAIETISNLRELGYYIVIWTSRTNAMEREELSQAPTEYPRLMTGMLKWLEEVSFPYDEIWMGGQKPPCAHFIDDRCFRFDYGEPEKSWEDIFIQIVKGEKKWIEK